VQIWTLDVDASPVSFALPPDADLAALEEKLQQDPQNEQLRSQAIEMGLLMLARGKFEQLGMLTSAGRVLAADATSVFSWPADGTRAGIRLNPGDKVIEAAAFDPTGKYVATAHAWDYTVRLWHADGSGLVRTLGAATESIEALKFSPDGQHLLVASKDETLRLWPTGRDDVPIVLRGHTSWVVDAEFTRDSKRVVTQSYDGTARVWNVDGSDQEMVLGLAHYGAHFDSTGLRIVTTSDDSRVAVWSLDARRVQQALSARTRICLDEAFRTRFVGEDAETAAAKAAECRRQRQP
jgi:dipeptidyl aminopeptidase/acylaminoacyl peptidase